MAGRIGNGGSIINCYVTGTISGSGQNIGGIVGDTYSDPNSENNRVTITDSYTSATVTSSGSQYVGGVVGGVYSNLNLTNCYSTGNISGTSSVGGIVGSVLVGNLNLTNCYSTGNVSGTGTNGSVGGVVGSSYSGNVTYCYSTGAVSGSGYYVGGVVGEGNATNCYSTGTVSGTGNVGGVVGQGDATNCYATGAVSGSGSVGGVVGYGTATNCYATGAVSGTSTVGGIAGGSSAVIDCAALNPSVKAIGQSNGPGRVTGQGGSTSSFNVAFADMGTDGGLPFSTYAVNGTDITLAEIGSDGTIGGLFTDTDIWTIVPGKLPGLFGKAVDMPEHLGGTSNVSYHRLSRAASPAAFRVLVRNRTLTISPSSPESAARVRLIDMRGKSVASFTARGAGSLSLANIPAGRYFVEVREGARRERASVVIGVR